MKNRMTRYTKFGAVLSVLTLTACGGSTDTKTNLNAVDTTVPVTDWRLIWSDEFDGTAINGNNWTHEVNCDGGGNQEKQCYTDTAANSFVSDGVLSIVALPAEAGAVQPYTSARMTTENKVDIQYGRIEMRAKLPKGQGAWPAFWMMPTDSVYGGWPNSGEIDIMEAVNLGTLRQDGSTQTQVYGTLHYGPNVANHKYSGKEHTPSVNPADDFNTYAIEWQEGEIRWYMNDYLYATQRKSEMSFDGSGNVIGLEHQGWFAELYNAVSGELENNYSTAPFDQDFFMILNVAVGGEWPENSNDGGIDADAFAAGQTMQVDYVRVYQCTADPATGRGCETVRQGYADEGDGLVIGEAPIPVADQGELTAPVSKSVTLGEGFGGATIDEDTNTLTFPSGSEAWAGFANTDRTVYPFVFPYGGSVSFNAAIIEGGSDADVYFRFERMPHPDVDPAFNTDNMTISGSTATSYTIDIPVQDAENTFSSLIFYIVDQDAPIVITDIVVTSNGPGAVAKSASFTEAFGGATFNADTTTYNFPAGSEGWAGFANMDESIYPLSFPNGGSVSFTGALPAGGSDTAVNFRFERLPHPDVDPAFSTTNVIISGTDEVTYTVNFEAQGENTFRSLLLYIVDQDSPVIIKDVVVTAHVADSVSAPATFTGSFGGANVNTDTSTYNFPSGSEVWAGFANENQELYPFSFPNGGTVTFTGALPAGGSDTDINFRFERLPHPDVDPAFSTANVTISGTDEVVYTAVIPPQDAENTFRSFLMYLVDQDSPVIIKNVVVTEYSYTR